jgi:cytoskeleton protein RodZ
MILSEFGAQLRQAREDRGISIETAADKLKLSASFLRALEDGERAKLPQTAFVRNFSRSYGVFLGIPQEEINKSLDEIAEFSTAAPLNLVYEPVNTPSTFDVRLLLRVLLPLGVLVLVAVCAYGVYANWSVLKDMVSTEKIETSSTLSPATAQDMPVATEGNATPAPTPEPVTPVAAAPVSAPAAPATPAAAPVTEAVPDGGQTLVMSAVSRCWISYTVDDEKVVERTLQKGDTLALAFKDKLRVTFGNVGGVRLTHNGKDLEKISKSGKYTLTLPKPE